MDSKRLGRLLMALVVAAVLFIIFVSIAMWYSQYTLGDHNSHLLWGGVASVLLLVIGMHIVTLSLDVGLAKAGM